MLLTLSKRAEEQHGVYAIVLAKVLAVSKEKSREGKGGKKGEM